MSAENVDKEEKAYDNAFMQQRLSSFYPSHSPVTVILVLIVVALVFIPVGVSIVFVSDQIFEADVRYDDINNCEGGSDFTVTDDTGVPLTLNGNTVSHGCRTRRLFTISKTLDPPVFLYYRLKGFHQNYRRYQQSRDDNQLRGLFSDGTGSPDPDDDSCWPLRFAGEYNGISETPVLINGQGYKYVNMIYKPCGAIAWSKFNDSISIYKTTTGATWNMSDPTLPATAQVVCQGSAFNADGSPSTNHSCTKKGIAYSADRDERFQATNPPRTVEWTAAGNPSAADSFLQHGFYAGEFGHKVPRIDDEDLMVWMRTAGLPDFRKLYRQINVPISAGTYLLDVEEHFNTAKFGGEKHIVLATTSSFGGQNYILGVALIVMGSFAAVLSFAFSLLALVKRRDGNLQM